MSQGEHRQQRGIACLIAKVVLELAACQFRTRGGLGCNETGLLAFEDVVPHEGEGDAAEVGTTAKAANHHIGIFACHRHLLFCLQADNRLMQGDVAQHGAEGVFAVRRGACQFDGFGDCRTQRTLVVGVFSQDVLSCTGRHGGRRSDQRAESLHHAAAIGLLFVADFNLIDGCFQSEKACGV